MRLDINIELLSEVIGKKVHDVIPTIFKDKLTVIFIKDGSRFAGQYELNVLVDKYKDWVSSYDTVVSDVLADECKEEVWALTEETFSRKDSEIQAVISACEELYTTEYVVMRDGKNWITGRKFKDALSLLKSESKKMPDSVFRLKKQTSSDTLNKEVCCKPYVHFDLSKPLPDINEAKGGYTLNSMIGKKVIIRTYSAGVWFGTLSEKAKNEVILTQARRMYKWWAAQSITLSACAKFGINQDRSKIVEAIPYVWLEAIEIIPCTDIAIESIEGAQSVVAS